MARSAPQKSSRTKAAAPSSTSTPVTWPLAPTSAGVNDRCQPATEGQSRHKCCPLDGYSNGSASARAITEFPLHRTAPIQGSNSRTHWTGTGEGAQYLHQDAPSQQDSTSGLPETFPYYHVTHFSQAGQNSNQAIMDIQSQWNSDRSQNHMAAEDMARYPSQDSIGAHSHRHTSFALGSYDPKGSPSMYPSVPQVSFEISSASSDATGRSHSPENAGLYTTHPMDLEPIEEFQYPPGDDISEGILFHGLPVSGISCHLPNDAFASGTSTSHYAGDEGFVTLTAGSNLRDSVIYNPCVLNESPQLLWENSTEFLPSQGSSPEHLEDHTWALPPSRTLTSSTNSPFHCSPNIDSLSPTYTKDFQDLTELPYANSRERVTRKSAGPRQSKVASDLAAASRKQSLSVNPDILDEGLKFVSRSSVDIDNSARDHPLYHNVSPQADGLYHCPWEGQESCQHKPDKLKCGYDKFVDSHLKPYHCKVPACEALRFSSTACLLRHEREAHAMHGHGSKPFLCTYEGCERGVPGNGFPRHWNLCDHMKRVHNDAGPPKSTGSGSPPPATGTTRVKKRKTSQGKSSTSSSSADKGVKGHSKSATAAKTHSKEPSLIERYQQSNLKLLETVNQLNDPRNASTMEMLRNANDCLKVMAQTHQRIHSAPGQETYFNQESG